MSTHLELGERLNVKELELMCEGLRIALKHAKDKRRFIVLEGMYAESLVTLKLFENGNTI